MTTVLPNRTAAQAAASANPATTSSAADPLVPPLARGLLVSGFRSQLLVGLLMGLVVFGVLWQGHPFWPVPQDLERDFFGAVRRSEKNLRLTTQWQRCCHGTAIALLGSLFAAGAGLAEGCLRHSWRRAAAGAGGGLLLGGLAGWSAGWIGDILWMEELDRFAEFQISETMYRQAIMWGIVAPAVGCSMALPSLRLGTMGRATGGALIGGLVSALVFGIVAAYFSPVASTESVVPHTWGSRLFWLLMTAGLMGALGGWRGSQHSLWR